MAVDEALLAEGHDAHPVLRVYRWDRPTLSFGYFLPHLSAQAVRGPGESLTRRWTGGGLVHHAEALTWTLMVPSAHPFSQIRPVESYRRLHEVLAATLEKGGLGPLTVVPSGTPAPAEGLCAEAAAPGDILREGRKIAGSGQRRTRDGLLHQGVIFWPESGLGEDFPRRLAEALAGEVLVFSPDLSARLPLERYQDPAWNTRR